MRYFSSLFTFLGHFYESYFENTPVSSGCQGATVRLTFRFRPKGFTCGGNVFPFEYRPWSIPERITLSLPQGWSYQAGSGQVSYGRTSGRTCTASTLPINPVNLAAAVLEFPLATLSSPLSEAPGKKPTMSTALPFPAGLPLRASLHLGIRSMLW